MMTTTPSKQEVDAPVSHPVRFDMMDYYHKREKLSFSQRKRLTYEVGQIIKKVAIKCGIERYQLTTIVDIVRYFASRSSEEQIMDFLLDASHILLTNEELRKPKPGLRPKVMDAETKLKLQVIVNASDELIFALEAKGWTCPHVIICNLGAPLWVEAQFLILANVGLLEQECFLRLVYFSHIQKGFPITMDTIDAMSAQTAHQWHSSAYTKVFYSWSNDHIANLVDNFEQDQIIRHDIHRIRHAIRAELSLMTPSGELQKRASQFLRSKEIQKYDSIPSDDQTFSLYGIWHPLTDLDFYELSPKVLQKKLPTELLESEAMSPETKLCLQMLVGASSELLVALEHKGWVRPHNIVNHLGAPLGRAVSFVFHHNLDLLNGPYFHRLIYLEDSCVTCPLGLKLPM